MSPCCTASEKLRAACTALGLGIREYDQRLGVVDSGSGTTDSGMGTMRFSQPRGVRKRFRIEFPTCFEQVYVITKSIR